MPEWQNSAEKNEQLKMKETKKKETKTIAQGSLAKVYLGLKQINCKIWKKIWYFSWFVWKVSESGVFSSLYFVKFGLKWRFIRIVSEYGK